MNERAAPVACQEKAQSFAYLKPVSPSFLAPYIPQPHSLSRLSSPVLQLSVISKFAFFFLPLKAIFNKKTSALPFYSRLRQSFAI